MSLGARRDFGLSEAQQRILNPTTSYPTANIKDLVLVEDVLLDASYVPTIIGTPRKGATNYRLVAQKEVVNDGDKQYIRRIWATTQKAQEIHNLSLKYLSGSRTNPIYIRKYTILRSDYTPLDEGTPLTAVIGISLTDGGTGYTTAPTVTITGTGTGAQAIAQIRDGAVISVQITNEGTGYTADPIVSFSGGGGSGAAATALIQDQAALLVDQEATPERGEMGNLFCEVTRTWQTLPGPVLTYKDYDAATATIVIETRQLIVASAPDYTLTAALTDYRDIPQNTATKMRIIRTYPGSILSQTLVEFVVKRFQFPALLVNPAGALEGLTRADGQKLFLLNLQPEADRELEVPWQTVTTFTNTQPDAAAIMDGVVVFRPRRNAYTGPLFSVHTGPVLQNASSITATTGTDDPIWGSGLVQTYNFLASSPTADAYIAARNAGDWFVYTRSATRIANGLWKVVTISLPYA